MNLQVLNVDLFQKLSLAIAIIRNTPPGIKPDVFTRSLAKRLFPRHNHCNQFQGIVDEYLLLRQADLLSRILPSRSTITTSLSLMDINNELNERPIHNEYQYGEFAEKVCKLKEKTYRMKVEDIEYLLTTIIKWLTNDNDHHAFPIDACLYTIQLIANNLKTDNDKPYHIVLDLLPMIDKFLDGLLDLIERTKDNQVVYLHQMIVSLASSNSCISRLLDKLCSRLCQLNETIDIPDDYDRQFLSNLPPIDPIDRLFNLLHEIIYNRCHFQSRLSQRSIDKFLTFLSQISMLLDGKSHYTHTLKLHGQLQAANYHRTGTTMKTFSSYTSSSSSEHSQYPQQQKHYSIKAPAPTSKINNLDYSISQQSQSQYF